MYAYCVIEYPVKTLDKMFTYKISEKLTSKLKVGMKVLVPFNTKLVYGIVLKITNTYTDNYELKEIIRIENEFLVLNKELLLLGAYLQECTLCNLITAYQTMLPSSLKIKEQKQDYNYYEKYILLNKDIKEVLEFIETHRGKKVLLLEDLLIKQELNKKDYDNNTVHELEKLGLIKIELRKIYRILKNQEPEVKKELNNDQQQVYENILKSFNTSKTFLIHGVTGSGKTLIYLKLMESVLKENKTALLLVPEISLTEQITTIFYNHFGSDVAILHSGLSKSEKYDEYLKILNKKVKIVIGTRSAIFAPLEDIGIIIIDEEHSETYKQENNPRYYAIDIAKKRSEYHNCPLVMGSATPSLESMARAKKGVYELLTLTKRANNQVLPTIKIIDMKEEMPKKNLIISEELNTSILECLTKKEQVILLLNRRGYSTIITCSNCGFTYKCPNCEVSLTFHKSSNTLRCHYCGYTKIKSEICPNCKETSLNYLGLGTEKLESIIKELYPNAKVGRMDADTTSKKGKHEEIIQAFQKGEYDILIGTQMLSKGLDFPNCTCVGIINADTTLNIPDFRSSERTFALLSQASGRAGRGTIPGKVIIQTFNPDNETIKCVASNDYNSFYEKEMQIRKTLKYSPYYYLLSLKICSKEYEEASINATKVFNYLKSKLNQDCIILGPSTALNFYLKSIYRFSIIIKYKKEDNLKIILKDLDMIYASNKKVFLEIDLNPLQL